MGDAGFDVAAARAAFPALGQKQVFMDVSTMILLAELHASFETPTDHNFRTLGVPKS